MAVANIAFRVDASAKIGTGHVMRCLALANELREKGATTHFVCRSHVGHMAERIKNEGHEVALLPVVQGLVADTDTSKLPSYAPWLGADWLKDAEDTVQSIAEFSPFWLVVDHYAIDSRWERRVKEAIGINIMAIDGLADREHDCDLLLDQTYSPEGERRWDGLVPKSCERFVGPQFALLRPEFAEARKILRQKNGNVGRIFIAFGGVDKPNATLVALDAVSELKRPDIAVDVVIGIANPNRELLQIRCKQLENVNLHIEPSNVAELMLNADLAISGGGTMLLEQCYLNLPSMVVSIADNQIKPAQSLQDIGAVSYIGNLGTTTKESIMWTTSQLINDKPKLKKMRYITEQLMKKPATTISQILLK